MMIEHCKKCGGIHYGSYACPFTDTEITSMIEGCSHGPKALIPQPCADCERERLSSEGAAHAVAERLHELARVGGADDENASAAAVPHVPTVGDLGAHPAAETLVRALNAHEGDYQKQIEIADTALRACADDREGWAHLVALIRGEAASIEGSEDTTQAAANILRYCHQIEAGVEERAVRTRP